MASVFVGMACCEAGASTVPAHEPGALWPPQGMRCPCISSAGCSTAAQEDSVKAVFREVLEIGRAGASQGCCSLSGTARRGPTVRAAVGTVLQRLPWDVRNGPIWGPLVQLATSPAWQPMVFEGHSDPESEESYALASLEAAFRRVSLLIETHMQSDFALAAGGHSQSSTSSDGGATTGVEFSEFDEVFCPDPILSTTWGWTGILCPPLPECKTIGGTCQPTLEYVVGEEWKGRQTVCECFPLSIVDTRPSSPPVPVPSAKELEEWLRELIRRIREWFDQLPWWVGALGATALAALIVIAFPAAIPYISRVVPAVL